MSQLSNACLIAGLALAGGASAQTPPVTGDDPYAWLEDVTGEKSLDWVKARNAKAEAEIATTADFKQLEAEILAILDSDAKIPGVREDRRLLLQLLEGQAARARPVASHHAGGIPQAAADSGKPCSTSMR